MASSYTTNYGLCQWEPTDSFIRSEFNQDNARIDAALVAVKGAAAQETARVREAAVEAQAVADSALNGLADISYNVYNLALQGYYDGKQTGYKRALVFDGFRDGSMITSLSGGIQRGSGVLTLQGKGQGNLVIAYGSRQAESATTASKSMTGSGKLTAFRCMLYSGMTISTTGQITYSLTLNGSVAASGTWNTPTFSPQSSQEVTVPMGGGVSVKAGDTVTVRLSGSGSAWLLTLASDNKTLAGTFLISAVTGSSGRMTGQNVDLPACAGLRAWVRYRGGLVRLSVRDRTGAAHSLTADGTRSTVNLQGASCTEAAFRLNSALPAGNQAVLLDLDLNGSASMEVYDYGIVLL